MHSKTYTVQGMDCAECARKIEKGVSRLEGVEVVRVEFSTSKLYIEGSPSHAALEERVKALGYSLAGEPGQDTAPVTAHRGGISGFVDYLIARRETQLALSGGVLILLALAGSLVNLPSRSVHRA